MPNPYEVLLMLDPERAEERQHEIIARAEEIVTKGGGAWHGNEPWGQRKLAYEIDHKGEAFYHLFTFDCEPATLDELSRVLRITDGAMRHMAVRRSKSSPAQARPPAARPPAARPPAARTESARSAEAGE